ncbi:hypothetical protein [Actinoplanes sp. DH11]|uniref:hypothetical protein n=1 Tax=Actinoplanes sp. DH11 TaxID=2857011 RepID=UPI001E341297|nr:hypothetical protein [Actinoplanes sp. DH11]
MINYRVAGAVLLLAATLPAGCTGSADDDSSAARSVDCALSEVRVRWSEPVTQPRLTRVTLFRTGDTTGTAVLDEAFTTTITDVAAPPEWTEVLAASLGERIGDPVRTGTAPTGSTEPGIAAGTGELMLYAGVDAVSARFTADCATPVTGTFISWTGTADGALFCGPGNPPPAEPFGRLAREHCPAEPAPQPSTVRLPDGTISRMGQEANAR